MFNWFRTRTDTDFRQEVESHLEHEAERQQRQRGLDATAAGYAARRRFGNVLGAVERHHDSQGWIWMERLTQHFRYALRSFVQRPAFSITAIASLGVGIGFLTAIFTVFYALSYRALPVRDARALVNVYQLLHGDFSRGVNGEESMISYEEFQNYRAAIDSARRHGGSALLSAAVYAPRDFAAEIRGGVLHGEYVSCNYFGVAEVRLERGRGFSPDECAHLGDPAVVVLSHALWEGEFASDTAIVGRVVRVNQLPLTVIGVAEPGFGGLTIQTAGAWLPVTMQPALDHGQDSIVTRDWSWMIMAARLAPGASVREARTQMAVAARQRDQNLFAGRETQVVVTPAALFNFPEARQRGALVAALVGLLGAILVLMVCANIMNLLLARGIARRREIGIRLAIGASRGRLVEQLVIESMLVALLGGALGYALAYLLPRLLPKLFPFPDLQINLTPDARILALALLTSLGTALVFGLIPALHTTDIDLVSASKGAMNTRGRQVRTSRLRGAIVGVQVAGSGLLLIVSALFIRAAQHAATVDPGFATTDVVSFSLNLHQLGYSAAKVRTTHEALLARAATSPGVAGAGMVWPPPFLGRRTEPIEPVGRPAAEQTKAGVSMADVTPSMFQTLGIRMVAGRAFTDGDIAGGSGTQPAVVSQSLARLLAPGGNVIGSLVRVGANGGPADGPGVRTYVVTGVAEDVRFTSLGPDPLFAFLPAAADNAELMVMARTTGSTAQLERAFPQWVHEIDPAIVVTPQRLADRMAYQLKPVRIASVVAGAVGALAMFLAIVGIYGVVSYAVSQQTRDIAIRQALGATRRNVVQLVVRQGSRPVLIGLVAATVLALGISQVIRGALYGVSPLDPLSYLSVCVLLAGSALLAMYAPARRALRISPATALRED